MGAWGPGLYQNDVSEDVRIEYKELLQKGKSDDEALQTILENNREMIEDHDDAPYFWFALADTQWKLGRLDENVKRKALELIDAGRSLKEWEDESPKLAKKRAEVLRALKEKLLSEQPERKKISVPRQFKCEWKIGDVYAYPLLGDAAKEKGLYGKFMLLHKVGERQWDDYHIIPIVRLKLADGDSLPKSEEEFDKLKYLRVRRRRFEDRIYPMNGRLTPEENRKEIMELRCEPDENGMLWEYKMCLIITSKRVIPKNLVYVGNFPNVQPPEKEFIPRGGNSGLSLAWCNRLEEDLVRRYIDYNGNDENWFKFEWKIGDVYAYRLLGDAAKQNGLYGKYALLHKVDECLWENYRTIPIVRLKLADSDSLPKSAEEFDKLKYLRTSRRSVESKIPPMFYELIPEEMREEILNPQGEPDENGMLWGYKIKLVVTPELKILQSLVYVGNFQDVQPPEKEYVPRGNALLPHAWCGKLEDELMRLYLQFNGENPKGSRS